MAKTKNASQHNVAAKAHRNGIKRPQRQRYVSLKGGEPKFLRNLRFAKKHNKRNAAKPAAEKVEA